MRLLTTLLLASAVALPALAQIAEPPPPSAPSAGTSPAALSTAPSTGGQKLDEVGYDPKVKRDPYGNVIGDKKGGVITTPNTKPLRSDGAKAMRSDRSLMKAAPSAAPGSAPSAASQKLQENNGTATPTINYTNPSSGDGTAAPAVPPVQR